MRAQYKYFCCDLLWPNLHSLRMSHLKASAYHSIESYRSYKTRTLNLQKSYLPYLGQSIIFCRCDVLDHLKFLPISPSLQVIFIASEQKKKGKLGKILIYPTKLNERVLSLNWSAEGFFENAFSAIKTYQSRRYVSSNIVI